MGNTLVERPVVGRPDPPMRSRTLLLDRIERRIAGPDGRERIHRALDAIARDALCLGCSCTDWLPPALGDVLTGAIDDAVRSASRVAVATLVDEIIDALDLIPDDALAIWEKAYIRASLGLE
ncbi:MAG TPA: hypothetical protein VNJ28_03280 [Candidatus Limnocylindrales bacterium]|jgi:hypothetical protein|nr:hypothetical protein [Candidatus Limnocylindrales bacterium]